MRRHLPSLHECLELLALVLMVVGIQWTVRSWGWSAFFALGFIWNWAVLNGWVAQKTMEKRYRFSVLKGIALVHHKFVSCFDHYPRMKVMAEIFPAGLVFGAIAFAMDSTTPWWVAFIGSGAFLLVRRQLRS